jgi:GTP-binding protein EngB required for normal cell division
VVVLTKADKLNRNNLNKKIAQIKSAFKCEPIPFSTMSGIGKNELMGWIEDAIKK